MMRTLLLVLSILTLLPCAASAERQVTAAPSITRLTIDSAINPIVAKFISEQLDEAN